MTAQSTTYSLPASERTVTGKQVKQLRLSGELPAVVYGHNKETRTISVPAKEFLKLYMEAGSSSLIDLKVGDAKAEKVLVHDLQVEPATNTPLHVDFYLVNMKEKLQTEIELEFVGLAPVVDVEGATLIHAKDVINVECLPQDLVPSIEVDVTSLASLDDVIRIKDIKVPAGLEVLDDAEEVVVSVAAQRSEEEMAALDEAPVADVDVQSETGNEPEKTEEDGK